MFKNKNDGNVVYKCTIRLLEDADILECEFQVQELQNFDSKVEVKWMLIIFPTESQQFFIILLSFYSIYSNVRKSILKSIVYCSA